MAVYTKIFDNALRQLNKWKTADTVKRANRAIDAASKRHTETIKRLERKRALDAAEAKRQIDAVAKAAQKAKNATAAKQKAISDLAKAAAKAVNDQKFPKFDPKKAAAIKRQNQIARGELLPPKKAKSDAELRALAVKQKEELRKSKDVFTGRKSRRVMKNQK